MHTHSRHTDVTWVAICTHLKVAVPLASSCLVGCLVVTLTLWCCPQHPVLDEPIAEAVCIIADTDRWTVQLASSQRRATEPGRLGKEVLVSSLVSSLLQSTQQLLKLNLSPNFVGVSSTRLIFYL